MKCVKIFISKIFLILCILSTIVTPIYVNAYTIDVQGGFSPVPTTVRESFYFSSETKTAVSNACLAWNYYSPIYNIVTKADISTYLVPSNGIYYEYGNGNQITKYEFGTEEAIAYTYRYFNSGSGSEITSIDSLFSSNELSIEQADICLNVSFPYGTASTSYNPQAVLTHEIGHLLGFGHSTNSSAIMYYYIPRGVNKGVSQDDVYALQHIYGG